VLTTAGRAAATVGRDTVRLSRSIPDGFRATGYACAVRSPRRARARAAAARRTRPGPVTPPSVRVCAGGTSARPCGFRRPSGVRRESPRDRVDVVTCARGPGRQDRGPAVHVEADDAARAGMGARQCQLVRRMLLRGPAMVSSGRSWRRDPAGGAAVPAYRSGSDQRKASCRSTGRRSCRASDWENGVRSSVNARRKSTDCAS
jgi:hypothetical protein